MRVCNEAAARRARIAVLSVAATIAADPTRPDGASAYQANSTNENPPAQVHREPVAGERDSTPSRIKAPSPSTSSPFEGITLPSSPARETTSPEQRITPPAAAGPEHSSLLGLMSTLFGSAAATVAMGWYYLQVRSRQTATSLTASALYATNDLVLFGTAALTPGQGWTTPVVYGVFAAFGLAVLHRVWMNDRDDRIRLGEKGSLLPDFSTTDKVCMGACTVGLLSIVLSKLPMVAETVDPSSLLLLSSALGSAVSTTASIPMLVSTLGPIKPGELLVDSASDSKSRLRQALTPALPWLLGTSALIAGLVSIDQYSLGTLLSPLVLCANNALITSALIVWAWRRNGPREAHETAN